MKIIYKISLYIFLLAFIPIDNHSQDVAISEYKNDTHASNEWTELIVFADNADISGFILRDYSLNGRWVSGIKFKDHQLWESLTKGTIIVINHRGQTARDVNISDGYIEIDAENQEYFEKYIAEGSAENNWIIEALNIAKESDILQLLDGSENHHHCLAHMSSESQVFSNLPQPKLAHKGSAEIGSSICIIASSIDGYKGGFNTANTCNETNNPTKGTANICSGNNSNLSIWNTLRTPEWNNPVLSIFPDKGKVELNWSEAAADNQSNTLGYIVLKCYDEDINDYQLPENGNIYAPNQKIGSNEVLANLSADKNKYITDMPCDTSISFSIVAYNFSASDINPEKYDSRESGRGRAYNTNNYPKKSVRYDTPPIPELSIVGDRDSLCLDEIIKIASSVKYTQEYDFHWYIRSPGSTGFIAVSDLQDTLTDVLERPGIYRFLLILENEIGCTSPSDTLEIRAFERPDIFVTYDDRKELIDDTTYIRICNGELKTFIGHSNFQEETIFRWYHNDGGNEDEVVYSDSTFTPELDGIYYLIAYISPHCPDTSNYIELEFVDEDFDISPSNLFIYIKKTEPYNDKKLFITNNSDDDLILTEDNIEIPAGFVNNTPLPLVIGPGETKHLSIRSYLSEVGKLSGNIIIKTECTDEIIIPVLAEKSASDVAVAINPKVINFGDNPYCFRIDTTIVVHSNVDCKIIDYRIDDDIYTAESVEDLIGKELKPDEQIEIKITAGPGKNPYNFDSYFHIFFSYGEPERRDSAGVLLESLWHVPNVRLFDTLNGMVHNIYNLIDFNQLPDCHNYMDTTIIITHMEDYEMDIHTQFDDPRIQILDVPFTIGTFPPAGNNEKLIVLRYTPSGQNEVFYTSFKYGPCDDEYELKVYGSASGSYTISTADTMKFTEFICPDAEQINIPVEFVLNSTTQQEVMFSDIIISGPFSIDIEKNKPLNSGNNTFNLTLLNPTVGAINGSITLISHPCGFEHIINISGRIKDFSYDISGTDKPDTLDFGVIDAGKSLSKSIKLTNNGDTTIIIKDIFGFSPPFSITNPDPVDCPISLEPGNSLDISVNFSPNKHGKEFIYSFNIDMSYPCSISKKIWLIGGTNDIPFINAKANISDLTGSPGDTVRLPINISQDPGNMISKANINSIDFNISTNPSVLWPINVIAGQAIENQVTMATFSRDIGNTIAHIEFGNIDNLRSGEWVYVDYLVLLGNTIESAIILEYSDFISDVPIMVNKDTAKFSLTGSCNFNERLADISDNSDISLPDGNIILDNSTATYHSISDDKLTISLYNSYGSLVNVLVDSHKPEGKYELNINTSSLTSGVYYLVYKQGIRFRAINIIILK